MVINYFNDMVCVCSLSYARSHWLIVGHYSPVGAGLQSQSKKLYNQVKSSLICIYIYIYIYIYTLSFCEDNITS